MGSKPKPGGYLDRSHLARAIRLNGEMTGPLRRLVREGGRLSQMELLALLAQLGVMLTEQAHALMEMDRIRGDQNG